MKNVWNCTLETIEQNPMHDSFIGGIPKLPLGTANPVCSLCGHEMSFMFQIAFPEGHFWAGKTLALFFCLDCPGGEFCIPEMPQGESLYHVEIPEGFLDSYQRNFKVLVFDTKDGMPCSDYSERVAFRKINLVSEEKNSKEAEFTVGGRPIWLMGRETPGNYASNQKLKLLFQIREDFKFPKLEEAAPQADEFSKTKLSAYPWYDLFVRNRIYFWGTDPKKDPKVYISVQTD